MVPNREQRYHLDAAECGVECTGCKGAIRTGLTSTAAEVCRCAQRDGDKGKQIADMATHRRAHKENTLTAKEAEIFQLKTRKEEMDKHRFVLEHRIRELEHMIEPKKREIAHTKAEIRAMGEHLEREHRACLAMEADVCTRQEQIAQIMQESKRLAFRTH